MYKSNKQSLPVLKGGSVAVAAVAAAVAAAIAALVRIGVLSPLFGRTLGALTGSGGALIGSGAGGAQRLGIS